MQAALPATTTAASMTPSTIGTGMGALQGILGSQPQDLSSYFSSSVLAPMEQTLQQQTLPGIMSAAGGSVGGYQSTSESDAIGNAISSAYGGAANTMANTAYQTAQQTQANQVNALNQLATVTGLPMNLLTAALGGGTALQAAQQSPLTKAFADYTQGLTNTQDFVKAIVSYLQQQTLTPANQNVAQGGQQGALGQFFTGIAQGVGNLFAPSGGGGGGGGGTVDSGTWTT